MKETKNVNKTRTLGKPKPKGKAQDGMFKFKMPSQKELDEAAARGRGRIEGGWYTGRCTGVVSEYSKSSDNPMWTWDFTITKGPAAGRVFKLWTVLTDDAAWKVIETLEALGVECEPDEEITLNKKEVIGVGCEMKIVDDDGQTGDEEWSKLDKIRAHPQGAGYRPGKLQKQEDDDEDDRDYSREFDEGEEEEDERPAKKARREEPEEEEEEDAEEEQNEEEEEQDDEEDERPARKAKRRGYADDEDERPAAKKRGKAPVTLGKKRK